MRATVKLTRVFHLTFIFLLFYPLCGDRLLVAQTRIQVTQSGTRAGQNERSPAHVTNTEFVKERPTGASPNAIPDQDRQPEKNRRRTRKRKVYVKLGVTLGQGRHATEDELKDSGVAKAWGKCLERQGNECARREDMVVGLISDSTPVTDGTPVQMMIEYLAFEDIAGSKQLSKRIGYLYVINYVEYQDNTTSAPKLIYPVKGSYIDDNMVLPGRPVMLPRPEELWLIARNKVAAQKFETYVIIVSPEPLKDSDGQEVRGDNFLDARLVATWARLWGGNVIRSDLGQSLGRLITRREQRACSNPRMRTRDTGPMENDLTPGDPRPQWGFRKAMAPGGKMLVTIKLPFKDTTGPAASRQ